MRWMYGHCRHVLVPSVATRDALTAHGTPADRVRIWARGVDADRFNPARRSPSMRAQWRASDDHPVLLYVGRVSREKGLDLLPAMLNRLRTLGIVCRLVVAGDGPYRRELAAACPDVIFTGALGRDAVAEVFASADLFVFPSRTDTAGNVVLEAQASGLPVVVADAGGPRENIVSGITGLVCESADGRLWANAAATLLRNGDLRRAMGVAARRYACGRRWDRSLEPLFETYRSVCVPREVPAEAIHHAA